MMGNRSHRGLYYAPHSPWVPLCSPQPPRRIQANIHLGDLQGHLSDLSDPQEDSGQHSLKELRKVDPNALRWRDGWCWTGSRVCGYRVCGVQDAGCCEGLGAGHHAPLHPHPVSQKKFLSIPDVQAWAAAIKAPKGRGYGAGWYCWVRPRDALGTSTPQPCRHPHTSAPCMGQCLELPRPEAVSHLALALLS